MLAKSKIKSFFKEFFSYLKELRVSRDSVKNYVKNPYRALLSVLVVVLFGSQIFLLNEDLGILGAFEIDPRANINSINDLFKSAYYNMNSGYTSSLYGWTFFFINFCVLLPFKILFFIFNVTSPSAIFFLIKLILFCIGMVTIILIFDLANKLGKSHIFAFLCGLYGLLFHPINHWLYFIHPDSTGMAFLLLSAICFLNFVDTKTDSLKFYYIGLSCLVLSSLSKHIFLFLCLPLFISYIYCLSKRSSDSIITFIKSRFFLDLIIKSTILSLTIFFIIHPFAFLEIGKFLKIQIGQVHNNGGNIPKSESIPNWIGKISNDVIVVINLFIFAPVLAVLSFSKRIRNNVSPFFYWSVFGILFASTMLVISESLWMNMIYFYPMYPFMILNIAYLSLLLFRAYGKKIISWIVLAPISLILLGSFTTNFVETYNIIYARSLYKNTNAYKSFAYIKGLPENAKITWDHFVAMPEDRDRKYDCFYWSHCGGSESVAKFNPDYVIFNENYLYNGDYSRNTKIIREYVFGNSYTKIEEIKHNIPKDAVLYLPPVLHTPDYKIKGEGLPAIINRDIDRILNISSIRRKIRVLKSISYLDKNNISVGTTISVYKRDE